jgi:hypothetical protein
VSLIGRIVVPKILRQVYQFKISLEEIKPTIWRQIQVPDSYSFWDLHVAIQDAMGWLDYHLHQFTVSDPTSKEKVFIGIPHDDGEDYRPLMASWNVKITDYFSMKSKKALYEYDFCDGWQHTVLLEKIIPRDIALRYPLCIAGKRACPPEDCGGTPGYNNLIKIMKGPRDEEYKNMLDWLGKKFDPNNFNPEKICFSNPKIRWKRAMEST